MATFFQKLNLKDQAEIRVLDAPPSFEPELARLSAVRVVRNAHGARPIEFLLAFTKKQKDVDKVAKIIAKRAQGDAVVWFAYPKKSSKKYQCEFDRDTGWGTVGEAGFEPVRMIAIDEDWSVLRFRRVEFIKKMTRDKERAITKKGRARTAPSARHAV